jgi:aldehyde oxidoreductase
VLEVIDTPTKAAAANAPLLHPNGNKVAAQHITRGDVDKAFKEAAHVVTQSYSVPMTDHAFMEPECAIAMPDGDGLLLYTGSQSVYDEQKEISRMLKIEPALVRSQSKLVGGGFGGKEDMSVQHHAALMAYLIKKPVKVKFSRQESLEVHTKRHAMEMEFSTSCTADGRITGLKARIISDCGAYASLAGPVLQRACTHAAGPYHIDVLGESYYTNNTPGGAFRGFGVTQSCFAMEQNINKMAELTGLDPWSIRHKNAIRPGQSLPNGQIASDDTAFVECLDAVKEAFYSSPYAGIAGAMKNSGIGVGLPDISRCNLVIKNGKIHVQTSAACIGQGMATVIVTMVCQTLDIAPSLVMVDMPDTAITPNAGTTTASRQTLFTGEATVQAALQIKTALAGGKKLADLEGQSFYAEYSGITDKFGSDLPNPKSHIAYGYAAQVVIVDASKKVTKVVAAHDVGRVVNPKMCEGQVEGGVAMCLGYAFTEDFVQEGGYVKSKYGTLGLLRSTQVPEIETILIEKADKNGLAYGAKGIGEIAAIPAAPAAALACYRVDGVLRNRLPMSNTGYRK